MRNCPRGAARKDLKMETVTQILEKSVKLIEIPGDPIRCIQMTSQSQIPEKRQSLAEDLEVALFLLDSTQLEVTVEALEDPGTFQHGGAVVLSLTATVAPCKKMVMVLELKLLTPADPLLTGRVLNIPLNSAELSWKMAQKTVKESTTLTMITLTGRC